MTKLKTVNEVVELLASYNLLSTTHPNQDDKEIATTIITNDRQAIREALREGINELDFYGWDKNNQRMIKNKALTVIDDLLGGEVTE